MLRDASDTLVLDNSMEDYRFFWVLYKVDKFFLSNKLADEGFVVHLFLQRVEVSC